MPDTPPRVGVVLLAAGSGSRVGATTNKVLLSLAGVPVLAWSLRTITSLPYVDQLVVVHRSADAQVVRDLVQRHLPEGPTAVLVEGGATRHESEWRGLQVLAGPIDSGELDIVAIHDGARPSAGAALFDATVGVAHEVGGALPVRAQPALVTRERHGGHVRGLAAVQTPQAFRAGPLLDAYRRANADAFVGTDTASCVAAYTDLVVHGVPAPATNLKITFPEDVALAERLRRRLRA